MKTTSRQLRERNGHRIKVSASSHRKLRALSAQKLSPMTTLLDGLIAKQCRHLIVPDKIAKN